MPGRPRTAFVPATAQLGRGPRTTRMIFAARFSRKLIFVPRREAGPRVANRLLDARTCGGSPDWKLFEPLLGAGPPVREGEGGAGGATLPRGAGGGGFRIGSGGAGGTGGTGGAGGRGGTGGAGGTGGGGGAGGTGGAVVPIGSVGSVRVGRRSPRAGPPKTTPAKRPTAPVRSSKQSVRRRATRASVWKTREFPLWLRATQRDAGGAGRNGARFPVYRQVDVAGRAELDHHPPAAQRHLLALVEGACEEHRARRRPAMGRDPAAAAGSGDHDPNRLRPRRFRDCRRRPLRGGLRP
jgi:hypothetical protein